MKRTGRITVLICLFLVSALLTAGCAHLPSPKPPACGGALVGFTDALGRQMNVATKPVRVASLLGSFSDVWLLAGGTLCASADDAWEDFGLELEGAVNIGGAHSPSLELLLSAAPTLVLASASTASHVQMKDVLESAGITVIYFDVDNFYDYLEMLDVCTDITERKDLYEQNGLALKAQIQQTKAEFDAAALPDEARRLLLLRASASSVKAKGSRGTILGEMLCDLGCINIADSSESLLDRLSIEEIMRQEPYRIFVVTMGSNTEGALAALDNIMKEDAAWSSLEAVREGRLHIMDKALFNLKPNARWAQSYEILYETLISE